MGLLAAVQERPSICGLKEVLRLIDGRARDEAG